MEKIIEKNYELPDYAKGIMSYIHRIIGADDFILYGGVPVDLIRNKKSEVNDYDIAINSKERGKIKKVEDSLIRSGFKIVESNRKYHIYKNTEVLLMYAKNSKLMLDICFMDNTQSVGQFNIESLYWKFPEMKCVDNYDALKSIENKKIAPIRGLGKENIYILISRFLYLCSKYDISLFVDKEGCIRIFSKRLNKESSNESEQFVSCLSSIFKSILRAKNKEIFTKELIHSGIIKKIFPLLHISLDNLSQNRHNYELMSKIKDKKDLLSFMEKYLNEKDRLTFRRKIKVLAKRKWDKQDSNII